MQHSDQHLSIPATAPAPGTGRPRLRAVGRTLTVAASVLALCVGGFLGFVMVVAGGMSDPAPETPPDQYGPYWPEVLAGLALMLLSLGALIWFGALSSRGRRRLGLIGLVSVALFHVLGLLVFVLVHRT
ncbi:hypothetical protein [Kitasatospora sp. NPDC004289]